MNERLLIVNADDYGLTKSVNEAVDELFMRKAITSATILAPARFVEEACARAVEKKYPVGVHFTLHREWEGEVWQSAAGENAGMLAPNGILQYDAKEASRNAKPIDVTRELSAQIERLKSLGCIIDHADSHGGTLYGINGRMFFINAFRVCKKYGLPFRFPKTFGFIERQTDGGKNTLLRAAHRIIVGFAALYGIPLLDDLITNPYPIEKIPSYEALCAYYERELSKVKAGVTEVFMHPSKPDEALDALTPQWQKRIWEYRYLAEGDFLRFVQKEGFRLVSWDALRRR